MCLILSLRAVSLYFSLSVYPTQCVLELRNCQEKQELVDIMNRISFSMMSVQKELLVEYGKKFLIGYMEWLCSEIRIIAVLH